MKYKQLLGSSQCYSRSWGLSVHLATHATRCKQEAHAMVFRLRAVASGGDRTTYVPSSPALVGSTLASIA